MEDDQLQACGKNGLVDFVTSMILNPGESCLMKGMDGSSTAHIWMRKNSHGRTSNRTSVQQIPYMPCSFNGLAP